MENNYGKMQAQFYDKAWGEMNERDLSIEELMLLSDLCKNCSEERISYLVHMYNERSSSLEPVEAHFVARYAASRGYSMISDENGQTKFEKQVKKDEEDAYIDKTTRGL